MKNIILVDSVYNFCSFSYTNNMKKELILSTLSGLVLGAIMMNIAWKYNAQGEIYTNEIIDFSYWIFMVYFGFYSSIFVSKSH